MVGLLHTALKSCMQLRPQTPLLPLPLPPQAGVVRPPPGSPPPGSFTVLIGEHAGRTFEATPGREREVAEARKRMGRGVMDAHVFHIMRLRQSHLLSALLALSDSYMMDVLGKEGENKRLDCSRA